MDLWLQMICSDGQGLGKNRIDDKEFWESNLDGPVTWAQTVNTFGSCDCSSKSILCREAFNNQVDQMICFMNVSQPLSLAFACLFNGLKSKVVIVAGMEALHVPNNIDFPLPRLTQLWLPPNA